MNTESNVVRRSPRKSKPSAKVISSQNNVVDQAQTSPIEDFKLTTSVDTSVLPHDLGSLCVTWLFGHSVTPHAESSANSEWEVVSPATLTGSFQSKSQKSDLSLPTPEMDIESLRQQHITHARQIRNRSQEYFATWAKAVQSTEQ